MQENPIKIKNSKEERSRIILSHKNMTEYIENKKESTEKLLELLSKFSKLLDKKSICNKQFYFYIPIINIQKMKLKNTIYKQKHQRYRNTSNERCLRWLH